MTTEGKPEDQIEVFNQAAEEPQVIDQSVNPPPADGGERKPEPPKPETLTEDPRAAIAKRFKQTRVDKEPGIDATGDFNDPAQTYGQAGKKEEPPPENNAPPAKRPLKVNGQEREVTEEELIALAQKAAAGDDYLEQAKQKLADAKQILETTRVQVSRQNPAEQQPAPTATEPEAPSDQQNPADPLKDVIEQIQYGDPDKAKELLGKTIADAATAAVKQVSTNDRVQQDIAADMRAHDEFVKKHADLSGDPIATSVIRDGLLNGYRDDLRKIGVPEERIPTDPTQLANHHRHYKLQGQPVRSVATLLDSAADRLNQWRGGTPRTETNPQPQAEPRIEVKLNREDRRRAIPQQPQRANVQPAQTSSQPQGPVSRHDAVQRAMKARGQA